jgi:carboxyl-terminal processing protease
MKRQKILLSVYFSTVVACGGGDATDSTLRPRSCDTEGQNQFVLDLMQDQYLYYESMPDIELSEYANPQDVLAALRVSPDRFSSFLDSETYYAFNEQGFINDFGFSWILAEDKSSITILYLYDPSPADLSRGDSIIAIDDVPISEIEENNSVSDLLNTFNVGASANFTVENSPAALFTTEITKARFNVNAVLSAEILETDSGQVGYLAFKSFIKSSADELAAAFEMFSAADIDELVLDLRYNGGGRLDISEKLASYLGGEHAFGAAIAHLKHNNKHSNNDVSVNFKSIESALNLQRLFVLTTESTCSASELVINALSPIYDVIIIGSPTCGKPLGANTFDFCDKTINIITTEIVNSRGDGEYFDGLAVTCTEDDDLKHALADPDESMLSHALFYIETQQCKNASE